VCVEFCPANAIEFPEKQCGEWYLSDTRFGPMVHAQLFPAEENSGRLVALLRQEAKAVAEKQALELVLSDGPPGIGCPVISSLSGTSYAVIVTEPTPSGRHDLQRVAELCQHLQVPAGVIINKCDLNEHQGRQIEAFCAERSLKLLGRLPHDTSITRAMINGQAVTEYQANGFSRTLEKIWSNIISQAKIR
jgi:MinD superfamily P-loop ATPase